MEGRSGCSELSVKRGSTVHPNNVSIQVGVTKHLEIPSLTYHFTERYMSQILSLALVMIVGFLVINSLFKLHFTMLNNHHLQPHAQATWEEESVAWVQGYHSYLTSG